MDPKVESQTNVPSGAEAEQPKAGEAQATVENGNTSAPDAQVKSQASSEDVVAQSSEDFSGKLQANSGIVSFGDSAAGSGAFNSMDVQNFLQRYATSKMFGVPPHFFQSRESLRVWGADHLTDPMVQPYEKDDQNLPNPFHVSLPGYSPSLCKYVLTKGEKPPRDPLLGPEITIYPPTWIPHWEPDPNFKPQAYNFNWEENGTFQMERLPYAKAVFDPADGSAHGMYKQAYPYTAYPYGVPRV
ncbi:conserved hypothetical protein [Neospora caninum Liverpool]|uniref:Uncharacterized protein n=2 Tax=Neospora caninum TaxID=29176 RepID=F0VP15_NEOCL|nr:conserved hypothetical protein [Neospora caninum Liverpool]ACJ05629.1 24B [Neospora caninum]CBZ55461.1 conserved hypothetical protein [Neospora caninum Liverpool]CEL70198.1 TPA: hypothetical protein BN1204_058840 [Neospora caninum Liverpool]|eukprot:XP_003885489.1 conserved hypothetical protein [Neospora caninum Liverpool]